MTRHTRITAGLAGAPTEVDLVVIGLGITGTGVALDAVSRGLSVLAVDAHDLAFGTSRWSSKLVHGGLRYLAKGQFGVAHESAVERGIIMERTAPHLSHAMAMVLPLTSANGRFQSLLTAYGMTAGDLLRRSARTSTDILPRPRRLSATEILQLAPALRRAGLRNGFLSWDGQLEDDARLVTNVARTAAAFGAHVRTRARVLSATGTRSSCATSSPARRTPSAPARSSTPPASGPGRSSPRSPCGPVAAPTWCCARRACPGSRSRSVARSPARPAGS